MTPDEQQLHMSGIRKTLFMEQLFQIRHQEGAYLLQKILADSGPQSDWFDHNGNRNEDAMYEVVNGVVTINVHGPIFKKDDWYARWSGGCSSERISMILDKIETDTTVNKVLFDFDSPGGVSNGTPETGDKIAKLNKTKQCIGFVSGQCCSAAYWWASQCHSIYSNKSSCVGSIGTYMVVHDYSELYKRIGIKPIVVASGKFKGAGTIGTKITAEQIAEFKKYVMSINEIFIEAVQSGRGYSDETINQLATGQVWVGKDAVSLGLIDGIRSKSDVLARMTGTNNNAVGTRADAKETTMAKRPNRMAQFLNLLNSHDDDDDLDEIEDEDEGDSKSKRGSRTVLLSGGSVQGGKSLLMKALADNGIETVKQLNETLQMAELGIEYRNKAIEYATKQAIRRYGAEKGQRIAAPLKNGTMEDIEAASAGWEAEADEKFGIGKSGAQAKRQSEAKSPGGTYVRSEDDRDETYASEGIDEQVEMTAERREQLMKYTDLGKRAIKSHNN